MSYSILTKSDTKKNNVDHYFTQEEWDKYDFASDGDMKWFRDARVGLFLHVGISAIGKVDISWSRRTKKLPDDGYGAISDDVYDGWAKQLSFDNFNANEWIKLAKQAGMRYVVVITKHHDGFHMWDTALSQHKITNTPFGRDYIKEIADACHTLDMPLGFYFSQRDWYHEDYEPVDPTKAKHISQPPCFEMNEGETFSITPKQKKFIEYMHKAVIELMTNYGKIDILWWDCVWHGGMFTKEMWDTERIEKEVRKLQPHIIINNRGSLPGDFDTPECHVGAYQTNRAWETCTPLGKAWAWTGTKPKTLKTLINQMVNCACGDGNYLLSIGCMPNGQLGEYDKNRLLELGAWLEKYGESIYGTRAGEIVPNGQFGATQNSEYIYIHSLKGRKVILSAEIADKIGDFALTGERLRVKKKNDKTIIRFVKRNIDTIIKLKK